MMTSVHKKVASAPPYQLRSVQGQARRFNQMSQICFYLSLSSELCNS